MDGGIYQCKPFYRRFQEKVWGYARGNITITMYLGNRLLRWLVIFFYFIINYAGKQNQFVLYYIMRTCFFTHHMHLFAIVNWVACSSLMGYLVHRYIVSISVRQRTRRASPACFCGRSPSGCWWGWPTRSPICSSGWTTSSTISSMASPSPS